MTFTTIVLITMWLMASFTIHMTLVILVKDNGVDIKKAITKSVEDNMPQGVLWCVSIVILGLPSLVFLFVCKLAKSIIKSL